MVKTPLALEHALLGFLRRHPMHAYEMHHRLQEASALGLIWNVKQSQLYALLARLEEAGYITSTTELQGARPPRKMLHLTAAGGEAFRRWIETPVHRGREFRQEFLAKLYFAQQEGPLQAAALLQQQREACHERLAELQEKTAALEQGPPYAWLVYQFRISEMEACLVWLDICAERLHVAPWPQKS
jgi:DNA-binding PadR family transcriptional regulator